MISEVATKKDLARFEKKTGEQFEVVQNQFEKLNQKIGALRQSTEERIDKLEIKTGESFAIVQNELSDINRKLDALTHVEWEVRTNHEDRLRTVEDELGVRPRARLRV